MRYLRTFLYTCMALFALASSALAYGHGGASITAGGIEIPALSHAQVAPMNDAYADIMAMANRLVTTDEAIANPATPALQEMMSYARWETFLSLNRMVPGSIDYDWVPTHKPTHASLATARELLVRMNAAFGSTHPEVNALFTSVDTAMVMNNGSITGCAYSMIGFNTANLAGPDISPNQLRGALAIILLMGAAFNITFLYRRSRRPQALAA